MKKISLISFAAAICIFFWGCASAPKISLGEAASPVAVMSVKGNRHLAWYESKDGAAPSSSQGMLSKKIDDIGEIDPEVESGIDRLNYAEEYLRTAFTERLGLSFLDKDAVVNAKKYNSISEGLLSSLNTSVAADGYKVLDSVSSMELRRFYKDTGANSAVLLKFDFFKKVKKGTKAKGIIVPLVIMRVKIYNQKGKEIFVKSYTMEGRDFAINSKDYNKDEFIKLYPEVIESLINTMSLDLMAE